MKSKITVETITVSQILDVHRGGEKKSSFVSATVRLDPPAPLEELKLHQVEVAMHVFTAAIQDAVATGAVSPAEARERLDVARANFSCLRESISKKLEGLE